MIRLKRLLVFIIIGLLTSPGLKSNAQMFNDATFKIGRTLGLIEAFYVDTVNIERIADDAIISILRSLDPHSVYVSKEEVKEMNSNLGGNFEGIGIQFNVLFDTIIVISPTPGGPSEKAGLRPGDRIVAINSEKVAGTGITTLGVRKRLLGDSGTNVTVTVIRRGVSGTTDYIITRDKIPVNSLDAAYMINSETGYLKLNSFSETTEKEFDTAVSMLLKSGMKSLMIDLRGNSGGYMEPAVALAGKFFDQGKLMVYIEGNKTPRQDYKSYESGYLMNTRVIVLTDEGSASASEILAGALQDHDRGLIVGRRTYGKGLVQKAYYLTDGSMIRLTIARYYTPSGRLIQTPYTDGFDKYNEAFIKRFTSGEITDSSAIHFPDSLLFRTLVNKRPVYGGGGIMPDIFVPADTVGYSDYYGNLVRKGIINTFALDYTDRNRNNLIAQYKDFKSFDKGFRFTAKDIEQLHKQAEKDGVTYDEKGWQTSENIALTILKGLVARDLWDTNEYFKTVNVNDSAINKAVEILSAKGAYNTILSGKKDNK